jgi:cell division protein FtsW
MNWLAPVARGDRTPLGRWFWTVDKMLLMLVFLLIGLGIIAVAAASPAAAHRLSGAAKTVDDLFFLRRHVQWVLIGLPVMFFLSMRSITWVKRASLAGTLVFLLALVAVAFVGSGTNGAERWLAYGGVQIQPSEFFKPLFVVTTAWLLALRFEDRTLPAMEVSFAALVLVAMLLLRQPDYGQTVLIALVWTVQAVLAGMALWLLAALALGGVVLLGVAYLSVDHVADRINKFITGGGDTYQIDKALDCFRNGGLFGTGPGEGTMKFRLPEPQTDYIFSVIGEEFGMIACLFIAGIYIALVVRVFLSLLDEDDPFILLAAGGLATQFGLQAVINMGVNLNLLPSKGMTLPFISHGGSSFVALCLGMGLLLALTRRNPFLKASPYAETGRAA